MVKVTIQYNDALAPYEHRYDKLRTCSICNRAHITSDIRDAIIERDAISVSSDEVASPKIVLKSLATDARDARDAIISTITPPTPNNDMYKNTGKPPPRPPMEDPDVDKKEPWDIEQNWYD